MSINKYTTQEVLNKVYTDESDNTISLQAQTAKETLNAVLSSGEDSLNVSLAGSNTITGDVTISGDLTVQGNGTGNYDEIVQGDLEISEALKLNPTIESGSATTLAFMRSGTNKWRFIQPHDDSYLKLYNDSASATQMYFASNNNVGIGTSSPEERIHSTGAIVSTGVNNTGATAGTERAFIDLVSNKARIGHFRGTTGAGSGGLQLYTDSVERMRIDSSGNVGIGISPESSQKLQVKTASNINFSVSAVGSALRINAVNDAASATAPLEMNASSTNFLSKVGINVTPIGTLDINISADARGSFNSGIGEIGAGVFALQVTNADGSALKPMGIRAEDIRLVTGSAERMRITDSGVGIGVTPSDYFANYDNLVVGATSGHTGITVVSGDDSYGTIAFADGTSGQAEFEGEIQYRHGSDNELSLGVAGNRRFVIDTNSRISLSNNDLGSANTIFGYLAGNLIEAGGTDNTCFGYEAGKALTTGDTNTLLGSKAGTAMATGQNNVMIGNLTGDATDGSSLNVFIGSGAVGASDATQNGTVAVGYNSLHALTSGSGNTAVGYQSMDGTDDGSYNTAVGYTSLSANCGDSNTCIGYASGLLITGSMNVTIGTDAGNSITGGTNNVVIGKGSDTDDATATNQTVVGYATTGQADNSVTLGNSSVGSFYLGAGNTSSQTIYFNDASQAGWIQYDHSADQMKFASANTINARLNNGSLEPGADDTQDLGSTTRKWDEVHANYVLSQGNQNHVANTMSSPYYRFDGVDDYIQILADGSSTFNSQDFTIEAMVYINTMATHGDPVIIWSFDNTSHSGGYYAQHLRVDQNGEMHLFYNNSGTVGGLSLTTATYTPYFDKWTHIVASYTSGSQKIYINGVEVGSGTATGTITYYAQEVWINKANYANGKSAQFSRVRFFNNVLNATEVKSLYSGASVEYKYKGANQTDINASFDFTSGWNTTTASSVVDSNSFSVSASSGQGIHKALLTVGKSYRLVLAGTMPGGMAMSVRNSAGGANEIGSGFGTHEFTATDTSIYLRVSGATGQVDISTFTVVQIGAVAEYDGSGIASDKWLDKSGNDLHATTSGNPTVENAPSNDDGLVYEEGTFTVTTNSDGTGALSSQLGEYTRIGNAVHFRIVIDVNTNFASNSIGGLPYTCNQSASPSSLIGGIVALTSATNDEPIMATVSAGGTTVSFFSGTDASDTHLPNTTNDVYRLTGTYFT